MKSPHKKLKCSLYMNQSKGWQIFNVVHTEIHHLHTTYSSLKKCTVTDIQDRKSQCCTYKRKFQHLLCIKLKPNFLKQQNLENVSSANFSVLFSSAAQ